MHHRVMFCQRHCNTRIHDAVLRCVIENGIGILRDREDDIFLVGVS